MKKMISVCLLFVLLLAGSLWIDQTMRSSEKTKPEEVAEEMAADTEKMTESMSHLSYTKYYVHASEGYVVIYQADHETVYCETSIRRNFKAVKKRELHFVRMRNYMNFLRIIHRNYLIVTFTYGNIKKVFNNSGPWGSESLKVYNYPDKYNVRNHEYK